MKLDPMQRSRDFTMGQHPRRGPKSTQRQLAEIGTRLTTAFDAFGGGGSSGSGLMLDELPEADASYIGKTVVVRTRAGQPSAIYTGSQDAFDNPVWVAQTAGDPVFYSYQYAFAPNPSPSFADFAVAIVATPWRLFVAYNNPSGGGYVVENRLDGSYVQTVSFGSTPEYPKRMAYDAANRRIALTGKASPPYLVAFQIWDETVTSHIATVGSSGTGNGQFGAVVDVAADGSGNWYAFDQATAPRVQKFTAAGSYTTQWGSAGTGAGEFTASADHSLTVDSDGTVHVLDITQCRVQRFSDTGTFLSSYGSPGVGPGQFVTPHTIRATTQGTILVTDSENKSVLVFANDGSFLTRFAVAQEGFAAGLFKGITESSGTIWVVNSLHSDNSVSVWRQGGTAEPAELGVIGIYQDANYTGSNSSSAQKVFNESANGAATVESSTLYEIEASIHIDTTGTTNRQFSLGFGGTATITSIGYLAVAGFSTTGHGPGGSISSIGWIDTTSMSQIVGNSGSSAGHYSVLIKGLVRINAGGTFIPQYQWSAAPGAAGITRANSYLTLTPVGASTVTTLGTWT